MANLLMTIALLCQVQPSGRTTQHMWEVDAHQLDCQQRYLACVRKGRGEKPMDEKLADCVAARTPATAYGPSEIKIKK